MDNATGTSTAPITGCGRNLKKGKRPKVIISTTNALMTKEVRDRAPVLMFSVMRAMAPHTGTPPASPQKRFDKQVPRTSLLQSNCVPVATSAIFAAICVSKMAITETEMEAPTRPAQSAPSKPAQKTVSFVYPTMYGFISNRSFKSRMSKSLSTSSRM